MRMLKGKTVVVGVCGGIAAYKAVEVVSRLKKLGAEVNVIMTKNATQFVTPLTFQTISHNPVITDMFAEPKIWDVQHISLAEKADLMLIAPATANIIGKTANGIADDMLSTTIMATKAPVLFVPAMNTNMYDNPVVQQNISRLKSLGYIFMEPDTGLLACGVSGRGRMPDLQAVTDYAVSILCPAAGAGGDAAQADMQGINVLITAGPTIEPIDPVRYISNHSSGKMGYAIAEAAVQRGASVKLISGPVHLKEPSGVEMVHIKTAQDMYEAVMDNYKDYDVIIMMAAVADYRCAEMADNKIKKSNDEMVIKLIKNPDIAKELGKIKGKRILVGACAETENLVDNALSKIKSKNFDIIMANDVTMEGAGFEVDTNIVKIIDKNGNIKDYPIMSKKEVASKLLDAVMNIYAKQQ